MIRYSANEKEVGLLLGILKMKDDKSFTFLPH